MYIDNNVQCAPMLDIADIAASLVNVEDGDTCSDDDVGDELPIVTYSHT